MEFDIVRLRESLPPSPRLSLPKHPRIIAGGAAAAIVVLAGLAISLPPSGFPSNSIITIPQDSTAHSFAAQLKREHVIRSALAFKALARVTGFDHHLAPGPYVFTKPAMLETVLWRIGTDRHGIRDVKVTFTEGMTRYDMADELEAELPGFDKASFLQAASTSEGYLFPETYLFMPGTPSEDIVTRLKSQFSLSIADITPKILAADHSFSDAVIMASIIEREAKTPEDKQIVAGILWNRIGQGMPLQVDAAFGYIHMKNGYTPTADDLDMDSPYNTYRNTGLPPTPISNPGLESILAAVEPAKTSYLYYLTGDDGKMHYARTFQEHKKNRALYLK
jgi:UPF0755 protein